MLSQHNHVKNKRHNKYIKKENFKIMAKQPKQLSGSQAKTENMKTT